MDYSQDTPPNIANIRLAVALVDALQSEWHAREWAIQQKFNELQSSISSGAAFDRQALVDYMVRMLELISTTKD